MRMGIPSLPKLCETCVVFWASSVQHLLAHTIEQINLLCFPLNVDSPPLQLGIQPRTSIQAVYHAKLDGACPSFKSFVSRLRFAYFDLQPATSLKLDQPSAFFGQPGKYCKNAFAMS